MLQIRRTAATLALTLAVLAASSSTSVAAAPGDLDTTFGTGGLVSTNVFGDVRDLVRGVAIQADGKIVVAGYWAGFAAGETGAGFALMRFNADGTLDKSFGSGGRALTTFPAGPASASAVAIAPDGKIVAAGWRNDDDGVDDADFAVARYTAAGDPDTTFSGDGKQTTSFGNEEVANGVAVQSDGRIVVVGRHTEWLESDFAIARYTTTGALDTSFDGDGKDTAALGGVDDVAEAVAIQKSDGKIVMVGSGDGDFALARYNKDGSLDGSFDGDGKLSTGLGGHDFGEAVAIQADGRIVVAGSRSTDDWDFAVVRYSANGVLDNTFGGDGKVLHTFGTGAMAKGVAVQPDGKIVAAGLIRNCCFAVARYKANGVADSSFSSDGRLTTDFGYPAGGEAMALQGDGKAVVAGSRNTNGNYDFALARYWG